MTADAVVVWLYILLCNPFFIFPLGMFFRPFYTNDPRLPIALEQHEPYIHFALVCGAKSCPPIKTYSADDVMNQVKMKCCHSDGFLNRMISIEA